MYLYNYIILALNFETLFFWKGKDILCNHIALIVVNIVSIMYIDIISD